MYVIVCKEDDCWPISNTFQAKLKRAQLKRELSLFNSLFVKSRWIFYPFLPPSDSHFILYPFRFFFKFQVARKSERNRIGTKVKEIRKEKVSLSYIRDAYNSIYMDARTTAALPLHLIDP
jgi:hypothetical protein